MKKLILGFAALAAATTFAAIESANIVGYNQKETTALGKVMIGCSFANVADKDGKFKLSDLSVTGYDKEEGAWGELMLSVLNTSGRETAKYFWFDCEEVPHPGWYDSDGVVAYDADKIVFEAGQGFWTQGYSQTVQSAGAVNTQSVICPTPALGKVAIANPYPVELKLSQLYVTDYDPEEGAWGEFMLSELNTSGRETAKYFWFDCEEVEAAGWYDSDGVIPFEAEKIAVPAGQGYWVQGYGQTLNFPGLSL